MFDNPMDSWQQYFAVGNAMMRMWADMAAGTMAAMGQASPCDLTPDAARKVRSAMFAAWAAAWDRFVRTPEFLQWVQIALSGGGQWQKTIKDLFTQAQAQFLGSAGQMGVGQEGLGQIGLAQVVSAGQQFQQQILDGMEILVSQMRRLSGRMDSLEEEMTQTRTARKEKQRKHAATSGEN